MCPYIERQRTAVNDFCIGGARGAGHAIRADTAGDIGSVCGAACRRMCLIEIARAPAYPPPANAQSPGVGQLGAIGHAGAFVSTIRIIRRGAWAPRANIIFTKCADS